MKRNRRVKILATLGPSSSDKETIKKLWQAGADVFRINMSHSSHEILNNLVGRIREVEQEVGRPIGILADLQGPKLRVGTFEGDQKVMLENGASFVLDDDPTPGDVTRVHLPHPEILGSLEVGHRLLLDDGKIRLRVTKAASDRCETTVEVGGKLSNRKGVSVPDTEIPVGALTEKDRKDLVAALDTDVDWVALSFVQRPEDLAEVHSVAKGKVGVLAKIEKPQAIERLDEIIELSDAIMIARGDLGVEMPLEQVPGLQKRMIRACRRAGKPVVVATQMLESMITAPVPTRAEVSDVATAVFEGADAVMLSAESAAGDFPVEAVSTMNRIAEEVEQDSLYRGIIHAQRTEPEATGADAITAAASQVAETLDLAAIVCYTASGGTALRASRERPEKPIIAFSPDKRIVRRLTIGWGLHCVANEDASNEETMIDRACQLARQEGVAVEGQRIIVSAGVPFGTPGSTNMLRIAFVGDEK
ncbi:MULTISPECIES: pyruvate kinase [Pseudovibrio]|uniref:pyruvate kinase n=1 Tax=Stappiaceae TaxID=2821832 RepID=UPI0023652330|nr:MULTISPECIES: pyruvate kinase [Pseudovibrio]MDD7911856.1 pyruvate kinase [Pseudovibrio exalbescens]MDX5594695.1 pyruvate kinase [Pseudovibrio sp. SPO723]